jgi:hypothetical protein
MKERIYIKKPEQQENESPEWMKIMLKVIANMQKERIARLSAQSKLVESRAMYDEI